jgi:hypothetical protein
MSVIESIAGRTCGPAGGGERAGAASSSSAPEPAKDLGDIGAGRCSRAAGLPWLPVLVVPLSFVDCRPVECSNGGIAIIEISGDPGCWHAQHRSSQRRAGGYDAVRRYAGRWSKERGRSTAAAYVPLSFAPAVRLEPRDRTAGRRDGDREGRPRPPYHSRMLLSIHARRRRWCSDATTGRFRGPLQRKVIPEASRHLEGPAKRLGPTGTRPARLR